jgi:phosphatidylserine/phosphatidylglycerophosphate/cardiolipin synthase-like enzyme
MEILVTRRRQWLLIILTVQVSYALALCQAFFTPQDNLTSIFINLIDAEQKSIHGAVYMFTDKKVAQALINAQKRGVDVQIIIDQISMSSCGKGKFLQENGVPVYVHRTEEFNPYTMALMHHKFFIFELNKDNRSFLWTGSWNCTVRATAHNDENVILLDEELIIKQYQDCFKKLLDRLI